MSWGLYFKSIYCDEGNDAMGFEEEPDIPRDILIERVTHADTIDWLSWITLLRKWQIPESLVRIVHALC